MFSICDFQEFSCFCHVTFSVNSLQSNCIFSCLCQSSELHRDVRVFLVFEFLSCCCFPCYCPGQYLFDMRTPNIAERMRQSREVKSNRDSDEFDRVKSKQPVGVSDQSGKSGIGIMKPPAYHSVPSSPVSDLPVQSPSRFLSIELQTLSVMSAREDIAGSSRSCIASLIDYLNANITTAERVIQEFRLDISLEPT